MRKKIVYTDEPMQIGRIIPREEFFGHGGVRPGAGRPKSRNKPVTLRLPEKLVDALRSAAKKNDQSLSEFVAARLEKSVAGARSKR